jgi:Tfp pilus assembly protein PilE
VRKSKRYLKAITALELIIVVVIMGILSTIAILSNPPFVDERQAKTTLKIIWQAEKDYFSYKSTYTNNWKDLNLPDPNHMPGNYEYSFEETGANLIVRATQKRTNCGFEIDKNGNITKF